MQAHVERVTDGIDLDQRQARAAATSLFDEATDAQIGALLAGLRAKGETEAEIAGFAEGMREAARTVNPDCETLVDTCGTGGDDYDTINVSTTSAIVAAGAGVPVAKHGNAAVSSSSGSSDVLQELGVELLSEPAAVEAAIERDGIGYLHAPAFHPAMKAVAGPRTELSMRTIFNVLGPLTNPAGATAQVIGVYDPDLVPVLANALARMSVERALVVHGAGTDEIAIHGPTQVAEVTGETVSEYSLTPADLGLDRHAITDIEGGSPAENAAALEGIVTGEVTDARRDVVLANAGGAIYVADEASTLGDGVDLAREAIETGGAAATLDRLRGVPAR
ncbi:anthranilate phosphoribosyltransferase [Halovivax asiaticus JCM 14624]|uniref:Anthranilate phosphoribosyltransferase n=1 Tax=Halovivax asiaticus JCM 14624 TaxID=1227490 RepID=M0BD78_9EURY|nr:anthranilate phosphoribosyltransferase [Halovivax asiaticus]ELZ08432.1 anthranilate phosphoribosyltransferase [Halovivax asiaticus JCM 14624]